MAAPCLTWPRGAATSTPRRRHTRRAASCGVDERFDLLRRRAFAGDTPRGIHLREGVRFDSHPAEKLTQRGELLRERRHLRARRATFGTEHGKFLFVQTCTSYPKGKGRERYTGHLLQLQKRFHLGSAGARAPFHLAVPENFGRHFTSVGFHYTRYSLYTEAQSIRSMI